MFMNVYNLCSRMYTTCPIRQSQPPTLQSDNNYIFIFPFQHQELIQRWITNLSLKSNQWILYLIIILQIIIICSFINIF